MKPFQALFLIISGHSMPISHLNVLEVHKFLFHISYDYFIVQAITVAHNLSANKIILFHFNSLVHC